MTIRHPEREDWLEGAAQRRRLLAEDPHRPRYHFLPPDGWTNDPNGVIEWEGEYHLFYQHNPHGPFWDTIHWGHAVSRDLVHWEDRPIALTPSPDGPDKDGCFSGCAVDDGGVPTLLYTGFADMEQTQCLATSPDGLLIWEKYGGNPVLAGPPEGVIPRDFRDPWVWREGEWWYMVLASGREDASGGVALLYRSADLRSWEPLPHLLTGTVETTGEVWECPNFFSLGDKHVLIVSIWPKARVHYFAGTFSDEHFSVESHGVLDPDGSFYAPLTMQDDEGRRLMWGWADETRALEAQRHEAWAGVISLPRVLSLDEVGILRADFVPELNILREEAVRMDETFEGTHDVGLESRWLECRATLERDRAARTGFTLCRSPEGEEETRLFIDWEVGKLVVDTTRSSLSPDAPGKVQEGHIEGIGDAVDLHFFLDGSVLEVIADRQVALCARLYPTREDALGVGLLSEGRSRVGLEAWRMKSIW